MVQVGDKVVSNRPFDTTKGHIGASGLTCEALTPLASPETFYAAESVFMGNIKEELFDDFV